MSDVLFTNSLYGVTVLQSLYYFAEFPKDKLILKVTVSSILLVAAYSGSRLTNGTRLASYGKTNP